VIELLKLPKEGLRLEGTLSCVQIEGDEALRDMQWQIFLQPSGGDYYIDIRGNAIYEGNCCRCLEPVDRQTSLCSQFLGSPDPELVTRGSHTLGTQDLDVIYLPEEVLDEESLVVEQFLLQRPMQLLCKNDCLGLCQLCGKNLNKGKCQCSSVGNKAPSALARALADIKLEL
jgi:uncharacterized protein